MRSDFFSFFLLSAAPKFKEVNPKYLEIPLGQKCKLRCPVSGNPQPTLEWFKVTPNGSLESVANSSISRNHLHIHSFSEEDQGVYWCKASNPHGTVATNFTVRVAGESSHESHQSMAHSF
ncbi:fibroblast growth factor receptor [Trichonephila clavipes]|uniref:Fibroblast growth factor receptor n=1 Tax=Trichonephila clavipes TaxID=2585209 RepID=A0A8X6RQS3_TRICX|nr:fibroblast growth factor receptor [Trichonephila clavipes]